MFRNYFVLFLFAHIMGDFYLNVDIRNLFCGKHIRGNQKGINEKKDINKKKSGRSNDKRNNKQRDEQKNKRSPGRIIRETILNNIGYMGILALWIILKSSWLLPILIGLVLVHNIIEFFKNVYLESVEKDNSADNFKSDERKNSEWSKDRERKAFIAVQLIHILIIMITAYTLTVFKQTITPRLYLLDKIRVAEWPLLSRILVLLILHRPANAIIQTLLVKYKLNAFTDNSNKKGKSDIEGVNISKDDTKEVCTENGNLERNSAESTDKEVDIYAGRYIGTLERIIILFFLLIKQYNSIAFTLTAKSLARFDRITHDRNFAEYYLLGTLLSTLIAIGASFLVI